MGCGGEESSAGILPAVPRASCPRHGAPEPALSGIEGTPPDSRRDGGATIKRLMTLDDYLREAEVAHGHLCAGQVLGVRLAMLGLEKLGIADPRGSKEDRKRLVTFVEIDRCATDAISLVTGCRLGKRALKFRDWGKMAATFVDLGIKDMRTGKAIRIAAKESSKKLARAMHPEIEDKNQQQMLAYREMAEDDLFTKQWVKVEIAAEEFPGYKGERIVCAECGEGINFRREVLRDGRVLCKACWGERYYETL